MENSVMFDSIASEAFIVKVYESGDFKVVPVRNAMKIRGDATDHAEVMDDWFLSKGISKNCTKLTMAVFLFPDGTYHHTECRNKSIAGATKIMGQAAQELFDKRLMESA